MAVLGSWRSLVVGGYADGKVNFFAWDVALFTRWTLRVMKAEDGSMPPHKYRFPIELSNVVDQPLPMSQTGSPHNAFESESVLTHTGHRQRCQ